jgi:hypothetical protein
VQQAIGGIEGEIRVAMQYMFQAWGARGNNKYREMLLNTGAEELGHIEMLSTAGALNPRARAAQHAGGDVSRPGRRRDSQRHAPAAYPVDQEYSYVQLGFTKDRAEPPRGRWTDGKSIDGNGSFSLRPMEPQGREPDLGPARENSGAQSAQIKG